MSLYNIVKFTRKLISDVPVETILRGSLSEDVATVLIKKMASNPFEFYSLRKIIKLEPEKEISKFEKFYNENI